MCSPLDRHFFSEPRKPCISIRIQASDKSAKRDARWQSGPKRRHSVLYQSAVLHANNTRLRRSLKGGGEEEK